VHPYNDALGAGFIDPVQNP